MQEVKTFLKKFGTWVLGGYALIATLALGVTPEPEVQIKRVEVPAQCEQVQCPVQEAEVVEKIVYKDSPETLAVLEDTQATLEAHKTVACSYTGIYPAMLEITEAYAADWGLTDMLTQDMYDLYDMAVTYESRNCR